MSGGEDTAGPAGGDAGVPMCMRATFCGNAGVLAGWTGSVSLPAYSRTFAVPSKYAWYFGQLHTAIARPTFKPTLLSTGMW